MLLMISLLFQSKIKYTRGFLKQIRLNRVLCSDSVWTVSHTGCNLPRVLSWPSSSSV